MDWAKKDGFFAAKVPREELEVPDIGKIWVHGLTVGQKDEYENNVVRLSGRNRQLHLANARAQLLLMTVHNQHGNRLFADEDMGRLCQIPAAVVDPILDVARRLSAMAAEEIEDLVKNSQTARALENEDSDTDSQDT